MTGFDVSCSKLKVKKWALALPRLCVAHLDGKSQTLKWIEAGFIQSGTALKVWTSSEVLASDLTCVSYTINLSAILRICHPFQSPKPASFERAILHIYYKAHSTH